MFQCLFHTLVSLSLPTLLLDVYSVCRCFYIVILCHAVPVSHVLTCPLPILLLLDGLSASLLRRLESTDIPTASQVGFYASAGDGVLLGPKQSGRSRPLQRRRVLLGRAARAR